MICTSMNVYSWFQPLGWEVPWRREWLPTPVFWHGEFHGLDSPWGLKDLDMTERLIHVVVQQELTQYYKAIML